jgi:hypothetical protein
VRLAIERGPGPKSTEKELAKRAFYAVLFEAGRDRVLRMNQELQDFITDGARPITPVHPDKLIRFCPKFDWLSIR